MTCKEKLMLEDPAMITSHGIAPGCPADHGYLGAPSDCPWPYRHAKTCLECWDREIPENDEKENKEIKENICPNYVPRDEAPRTSAEIKAELNELYDEYRRKADILIHEYELTRKREELDAAAFELKSLVDSYIYAGFTREEAMDIVLTNIKALSIG